MKVLQINAVYGFGSTGVIVKDIEDCVIQNGDDSFVAYAMSNMYPINGYKIGNNFDRKLHAIYSRVFGKQAYASKKATKKLLKWMNSVKPDVVLLHNLHSNYINMNLLCDYLFEKRIPTVVTLHDCWFFTGKCTHYISIGCDKWQLKCGECPLIKKEVPSYFFDKTKDVLMDKISSLNQLHKLIVVGCSEWISNEAKKSLLKPSRITTIYNGVDVSIFKPHITNFRQKYGIKEDSFVVLGMANKWFDLKNREVVKKIINSQTGNAKIIIVGCNKEQEKYFDQFDNVVAIGFVKDKKEMADIYTSADVFVNLTRADTLPTVNMESICCGTPVVTYKTGGSPELIDSDSGFVVDIDDESNLIEKIEFIKNKGLSINIEDKHNKFDKNKCYKKYLEVFDSLVNK